MHWFYILNSKTVFVLKKTNKRAIVVESQKKEEVFFMLITIVVPVFSCCVCRLISNILWIY